MPHVVVFIEGMNLSTQATTLVPTYEQMWEGMVARQPALRVKVDFTANQPGENRSDDLVIVQWNHPLPDSIPPLRPDQELMDAENWLESRIAYQKLKDSTGEHLWKPNFLASLVEAPLKSGINLAIEVIKDQVFMLGLTDVLYYTAEEGERAVRNHVYTQTLSKLEEYRDGGVVKLHLITHSQGATVGFDFLFGLFAPDANWTGAGKPVSDFANDPGQPPAVQQQYLDWRARAQNGQLVLGSFSTFGSQIALMSMRKQRLVDILAANGHFDPSVIGVTPGLGRTQWKNFYDRNDVLGYPIRPLYQPNDGIEEFEVDGGLDPTKVHSNYVTNAQVMDEIAKMIAAA